MLLYGKGFSVRERFAKVNRLLMQLNNMVLVKVIWVASVLKVLLTFSMVLDRINCRGGVELWRSLVSESTESSSTAGNSANQCYPNNSQGVNTEVSVDLPTEASPNSPPVAHPLSPQLGWSVFVHNDVMNIKLIGKCGIREQIRHAYYFSLHYRPKTPEIMSDSDPMFDSVPQTSLDLESSVEDQEDHTLLTALPTENSFIGVVVSGGDPPLVFNAHGLQPDPPLNGDPLPMHTDCPSDSLLLNESSADVVNSSYITEMTAAGSDFGFNTGGDAWFTSLDVPDNILSGDAEDSSSDPSTAIPTSSSETAAGASCSDANLSLLKFERTEGSADTHVKCEVEDSEECDDSNNSVELNKMRLLVDKDDKENARLLLPNKNEGVVVNETPTISENGDEILNNILNASEVCTIISEEPSRDSTSVNSSCVMNSSGSSEHGEVGGLEGIAKTIIDRTRTNPGGSNGQTLAMKSYTFSAPTLVRGRPSNGVVKRIGNGANAKTVVVEEV